MVLDQDLSPMATNDAQLIIQSLFQSAQLIQNVLARQRQLELQERQMRSLEKYRGEALRLQELRLKEQEKYDSLQEAMRLLEFQKKMRVESEARDKAVEKLFFNKRTTLDSKAQVQGAIKFFESELGDMRDVLLQEAEYASGEPAYQARKAEADALEQKIQRLKDVEAEWMDYARQRAESKPQTEEPQGRSEATPKEPEEVEAIEKFESSGLIDRIRSSQTVDQVAREIYERMGSPTRAAFTNNLFFDAIEEMTKADSKYPEQDRGTINKELLDAGEASGLYQKVLELAK